MRSWATMEDFEAFLNDGGLVEVDDDMPGPIPARRLRFHRVARQ